MVEIIKPNVDLDKHRGMDNEGITVVKENKEPVVECSYKAKGRRENRVGGIEKIKRWQNKSKITVGSQTGDVGEEIEKNIITQLSNEAIKEERFVRVGTLNVRGCMKQEKRDEINDALKFHNIEIAALQEVNAVGSIIKTKDYRWHVIGCRNNKIRGLAFLLRKGVNLKMGEIKKLSTSAISTIIKVGPKVSIDFSKCTWSE